MGKPVRQSRLGDGAKHARGVFRFTNGRQWFRRRRRRSRDANIDALRAYDARVRLGPRIKAAVLRGGLQRGRCQAQ